MQVSRVRLNPAAFYATTPKKMLQDKTQQDSEERQKLKKLKDRDREVRRHEQAHMTAGGNLVQGGPQYSFETGPDGQQYAVEGSVHIDTSKVAGDPRATIEKARQIRRAALAPADPSGQDRSVAAQASRMEQEAQKEIAEKKDKDTTGKKTAFYNQHGQQEHAAVRSASISVFA